MLFSELGRAWIAISIAFILLVMKGTYLFATMVRLASFLLIRCILDGEMLVWDASMNRFAEFGSNQEIGTYDL